MVGDVFDRMHVAASYRGVPAGIVTIFPPAFSNLVDTGEIYQPMQNSVALVTGFLVQRSFTLTEERRLVLGRSRTFVDLVAELYGELDDRFDYFITTNDLSGDEIIELPIGREVVYYK